MRVVVVAMMVLVSTASAETPRLETPARLGLARVDSDVIQAGARIVPDDVAEKAAPAVRVPRYETHPVDEFLRAKTDLVPRRSDKLGDNLNDLFDPQKPKEWLFSDHGFDCMTSPITNPFLAEDPRALTEIRPIFIYQKVPSEQPNFKGGSLAFFGARGSIALTDRISVTLNKLGGINVAPGSGSPLDGGFGFSELWLGGKYTFYRDTQSGTIAAGGMIFQIPTGSSDTFQDTGNLTLTPYVSVGKTLQEFRAGAFNGIAVAGMNFSTNSERSNYFYLTGHLDYDVGNFHRFYPVAELNWFQYTASGKTYFSGQGHDLINTGAVNFNSATLLTGALGMRFKITEASQLGFAFELPLMGNRDLMQYRFTLDFIFRY